MATSLAIELTIDRSELLLGDLVIGEDAGGYSLIKEGIGPGQQSWRRLAVTSPWAHGERLVHAVKDAPSMNVDIRVTGTSHGNLWNRLDVLTRAFSQFSYDLTFDIEGAVFTWEKCQPADWAVGNGGQIDDRMIRSLKQEVRFVVRRSKP